MSGLYLAILMIGLGQFGMLLFVTYYLQGSLRFTAIQSGLAFLPWVATFTTMAQVGSRVIAKRIGLRWTIGPGLALVGLGLAVLSSLGVSSSYGQALLVFGAGSILIGALARGETADRPVAERPTSNERMAA